MDSNRRVLIIALTAYILLFSTLSVKKFVSKQLDKEEKGSVTSEVLVQKDLNSFLETYFSSWSDGDMRTYGSLFHSEAEIFYIKNNSLQHKQDLAEFIKSQAKAQHDPETRSKEEMLSAEIDQDLAAATANVRWKLYKGDKTVEGVDRFTILKNPDGSWKIVSLVFYSDSK